MIVRIGSKLYATDFEIKDLHIFYSLGVGSSLAEVINNGAARAYTDRWAIPGNPAGSTKALTEVYVEELYVEAGSNNIKTR
jgi:hypothetical protein